ncbi:MAG: hypothetical protein KA116_00300 [Proteobacteria bacterium]|jgi:hypothetical protein|nr:hypothetical protein [Pseudomonadota bacterium]
MASSLSFQPEVKNLIPQEVLLKYNIIPLYVRSEKLCLISRRPLTNEALLELKEITGFEDYELQLVGDDVIEEYLRQFISGKIFESESTKKVA